jgi:hypothetical protein
LAKKKVPRNSKARGKPSSVLSEQRLKSKYWRRAITLLLISTAVLCLAIVYGKFHTHVKTSFKTLSQKKNFKISLKPTQFAMEEKDRRSVLQMAAATLQKQDSPDFSKVAHAVQKLGAYESVHVLQISADEIVLELKQRNGIFCINYDKIRYVSIQGRVYGNGKPSDPICKNLILQGLAPSSKRLKWERDASLSLPDDQQIVIKETIQLFEHLRAEKYEILGIEFLPYRGFEVELSPPRLKVAIGRAPFMAKITKLYDLIQSFKSQQKVAEHVELDYHGKAFVKFKNL